MKLMALALLASFTVLTCSLKSNAVPESAIKAKQFFQTYCESCHGEEKRKKNLNTLDYDKLFTSPRPGLPPYIVKNNPEGSYIHQRVARDKDMPSKDDGYEGELPSAADIANLTNWINEGAPNFNETSVAKERADEKPIVRKVKLKGETEVYKAVVTFLRSQPQLDRPYFRFFSLRNISDQLQGNEDKLEIYRAALSKTVNSLNPSEPEIVVPEVFGPNNTVMAVDTRKLGWVLDGNIDSNNSDRRSGWRHVILNYPYFLKQTEVRFPEADLGDAVREAREMTKSELPVVRADWFITKGTQAPVYDALLKIPDTDVRLESDLKVNVIQNIISNRAKRAGMNDSVPSLSNRVVERHPMAGAGYYWKSYDFSKPEGNDKVITIKPLGPNFRGNKFPELAFKEDGGEVIWSLPNGMQAYMITNSQGRKIPAAPAEIVRDDQRNPLNSPVVTNGISCVHCHSTGINPFKDDVRNGTGYSGDQLDKIQALYIEGSAMNALVERDSDAFMDAMVQAVQPFFSSMKDLPREQAKKALKSAPEPMGLVTKRYVKDLEIETVASELDIDREELFGILQVDTLKTFGTTLRSGGTIKRDVWDSQFRGLKRSLYQEFGQKLQLGSLVIKVQ